MSVLMLLGGEVIQKALAQLAGEAITPVAFSFGWVTYSINALLSAVGENRLLPEPDIAAVLINCNNSYARPNASWVLGRILRDFDYWKGPEVAHEEAARVSEKHRAEIEKLQGSGQPDLKIRPRGVCLCVAVYEVDTKKKAGVPDRDWLWYSGMACAVLQLGISAIPLALWEDWSNMMVTAAGITFAFASGALPQWKAEKWACRTNSKKVTVLTKGNGTTACIVIYGGGNGLDLEDLAGGRGVGLRHTRIYTAIMAVLWLMLLISVSGLNENTWFLMAVGVVGVIQNIVVCGAPRKPGAFGIHLKLKGVVTECGKVMDVLKRTEAKYPTVGKSMVDTFFPTGLTPDEIEYWRQVDEHNKMTRQGAESS